MKLGIVLRTTGPTPRFGKLTDACARSNALLRSSPR